MKFNTILLRRTHLDRDLLYSLSTDLESFTKLMPENFKNLEIIKKTNDGIFLNENISFLGFSLNLKTFHAKILPNIHEIHCISGPLNGTNFIETYDKDRFGTKVTISVTVNLNGFWIILYPFKKIIFKKMSDTLDDFLCKSQKWIENLNS